MNTPLSVIPAPIGIGTAGCESLSSYVQRLAAANGTVPGQLLYRVLAWLEEGKPEQVGQWLDKPRHLRIGRGYNINGFTHADAWLRALQRATDRADLAYLTTRAWDHLFPTRGFLAQHNAWCPLCLVEDKVPYQRLAWSLQTGRTCAVHGITLKSKCPRCARVIPTLHDRSDILHCPSCSADLCSADADHAATEFDRWSSSEIGAIVATSSKWHRPIQWSAYHALREIGKHGGLKDLAEFARFVGTSKITVWYWESRRARPSLPMALHVYYRFNRSLAEKFSGESAVGVHGCAEPEFHLRGRRNGACRSWGLVEQRLRDHLASPLESARPLVAFANGEGMAIRTLREHFPELCRKLALRNRHRLMQARQKSDLRTMKSIHTAAVSMLEAGCVATPELIERHLHSPGIFNRRGPRRAFKALQTKSLDSQLQSL